jgi:hypothetical protein
MLLLASVAVLADTTMVKGGAINQVRVVRGEDASAFNNPRRLDHGLRSEGREGPDPGSLLGRNHLLHRRRNHEHWGRQVFGQDHGRKNNTQPVQEVEACPCNQLANFAFDSTSGGTETVLGQESHSMDRSVIVGPGTYTVKAQWVVTHTDVRFRVDDWSLTVEMARVS